MEDIRILFLAPNWRVSLLRSFKKSMDGNVFMVGADSDSYSASLKVVDRSYVIPQFSEQECIEKIRIICDKENIRVILPMTNKAITFMDKNRDWFNKDDLSLYLADHSVIQICNLQSTFYTSQFAISYSQFTIRNFILCNFIFM